MDVQKVLDWLSATGVRLRENNKVKQRFVGVLDETSLKMQKVMKKLVCEADDLNPQELVCYERHISSLSYLLVRENMNFIFYLLKKLMARLKFSAKACLRKNSTKQYKNALVLIGVCKKLRIDLLNINVNYEKRPEYLMRVYKLLKYENIFRNRM